MELFVKKQGGFTIIELILVIVVLGILAAYAVPKYMGLDRSARVSLVKALEGSLRSGVDMVHGRALIENKLNTTGDTVKLDDGTEIALAKGYPTADKVWDIIESVDGNNFEISSANGTAVFKVQSRLIGAVLRILR